METRENMVCRQWSPEPSIHDIQCVDTLRVMSYNILDDTFIKQDKYRYCPEDILYMRGRHHRIVQEILQVNADVVCLQEVCKAHFEDKLSPDLARLGYAGIHMGYIGPQANDGITIFYKTSCLELLDSKPCPTQKTVKEYLQVGALGIHRESIEIYTL